MTIIQLRVWCDWCGPKLTFVQGQTQLIAKTVARQQGILAGNEWSLQECCHVG